MTVINNINNLSEETYTRFKNRIYQLAREKQFKLIFSLLNCINKIDIEMNLTICVNDLLKSDEINQLFNEKKELDIVDVSILLEDLAIDNFIANRSSKLYTVIGIEMYLYLNELLVYELCECVVKTKNNLVEILEVSKVGKCEIENSVYTTVAKWIEAVDKLTYELYEEIPYNYVKMFNYLSINKDLFSLIVCSHIKRHTDKINKKV